MKTSHLLIACGSLVISVVGICSINANAPDGARAEDKAVQYEYRLLRVNEFCKDSGIQEIEGWMGLFMKPEKPTELLNKYSDDGWEVAAANNSGVIFKRPRKLK